MADTLITRLSNIKELVVRSTSAVLKYAAIEQDPAAIGRELQTDFVLEGSIRRIAERMRVTVRLLKVADGSSLWGDKFDESFTDIFAVEDSICERVAQALTSKLSAEEKSLLAKRPTQNPEAYKLYLRGRYYSERLTKEGFDTAVECLQKALDIDPQFALAYEGLAYNYIQALDIFLSPSESLSKAREALEKALQLDDTIAESYTALGCLHFWQDWDWAAAEEKFLHALELNPNAATSHQMYGWFLTFMGRFDEAFAALARALQLDPISFEADIYHGPALYLSRQYDRAIEHFQKVTRMYPSHWLSWVIMGRAYEQKGMYREAIAVYQKARQLELSVPEILMDLGRAYGRVGKRQEALNTVDELHERAKQSFVAPFHIAMVYIGLDETDQAFAWLEKAIESRSWYMTWLQVAPELDALRPDPRFVDLMQRVGFTA